ncbi:MAG: lysophospholipid acyltransferase family protein [Stagnimonas sp.]|nr:lysophospholipid acyltransferase family protein [Stagnimonas sp.]
MNGELGFPRGGNAGSRAFGRAVLRLFGWRLDIQLPDLPKAVITALPHTSNWDFVFAMAAILALGLRIRWFGKHTLFQGPLAPLMRALGGIPIDRGAAAGVVAQTTAAFHAHPQLILGLAPEGTRRLNREWKRGWQQIAHAAQVPVLPAYIDHRRKVVGLFEPFRTSGDYAVDLARLKSLYRPEMARHPELFGL